MIGNENFVRHRKPVPILPPSTDAPAQKDNSSLMACLRVVIIGDSQKKIISKRLNV